MKKYPALLAVVGTAVLVSALTGCASNYDDSGNTTDSAPNATKEASTPNKTLSYEKIAELPNGETLYSFDRKDKFGVTATCYFTGSSYDYAHAMSCYAVPNDKVLSADQ